MEKPSEKYKRYVGLVTNKTSINKDVIIIDIKIKPEAIEYINQNSSDNSIIVYIAISRSG